MELFRSDQIALDQVAGSLLDDVEETARRVNEFRPLSQSVVRRIEAELLGERVYSSNAIEGNTLNLRETVTVLNTGRLIEGRRREAAEARNLGTAVSQVAALVLQESEAHTVANLLETHRTILLDIDDSAGSYRSTRVMITGARHQPPDHTLVPTLVERILEQLMTALQPNAVVRAAWAHWALARVHPFKDGNGRLARLWQDLVLLQSHLTCAIVRPEQRREYLDALMAADEGDFNALVQLVARCVLTTFDKYLIEIGHDQEIEDFVAEVAGEADQRVRERRELTYQRWVRKMEQLRWEFEICAARVTEASSSVKIQLRKYDMITSAQWDNLRVGTAVPKTWFFSLNFDCDGKRLRYVFFFGKHYATDLDNEQDRSENRVCLLISEDDGSGHEFRRLDQVPDCPISFREVFLVGDRFVVKRCEMASAEPIYDRGLPPLRIAQNFIKEVILRRLT